METPPRDELPTKNEIIVQETKVIVPPDSGAGELLVPIIKPSKGISAFSVLRWVFDALWLIGWGTGGGFLLTAHWYIAVPMLLLAPLPLTYDVYKSVKK